MQLKSFFPLALLSVLIQTGCSEQEEPQPIEFEYGVISSIVNGVEYEFGLTQHTFNSVDMVEVKGDKRLKLELWLPNDGDDLLMLKPGTYGVNHSQGEFTSPVLLDVAYSDPSYPEALTLRSDPQTEEYYHTVEYIKYLGQKHVSGSKGSFHYDLFEIKGTFRGRVNNWDHTVVKDISGSYKVLYAANPM